MAFSCIRNTLPLFITCNPGLFPKQQILESSKFKEFADDNLKSDKNGTTYSNRVKNTMEKRRNCSLQAISPSSKVFSKELDCRHVQTWFV